MDWKISFDGSLASFFVLCFCLPNRMHNESITDEKKTIKQPTFIDKMLFSDPGFVCSFSFFFPLFYNIHSKTAVLFLSL